MTDQVQSHILKKYELVKKVGSGAYGHVWKVVDKKSGETLALKKIFDAFQHSTDAQRTYREIVFLHQLNHPNIIKLFSVIKAENDKDLYLVFEYMEADLHNAIGQKILKDAHNRYIIYQLLKGLKFMHSAEVIHRDLKPSNLLLNSDCNLKICDFGLARSLAIDKKQQKDIVLTQEVATRWYRAPEVLLGSNFYDKSADIWSVGCILAEMLIGKPIFPGNSTLNQLQKIISFTGKPKIQDIQALNSETAVAMFNQVNIKQKPIQQWFKSTVPQEGVSLILSMLAINPKKRPNAQQVLKHPFLASFHKPKEQTVSDKVIQPPISDNTKLNVKQYRKLIYQRIKTLYMTEEALLQSSFNINQNSSAVQIRKSVERSITRQISSKTAQKKNVPNQQFEQKEKQPDWNTKPETVQRPSTQYLQKKTSASELLVNNPSLYRNVKSSNSNSNHLASKNVNRYSSTSNNKKTIYGTFKSSSSSLHSSTNQCSSGEEVDITKKKNSLKQILKAKRQIGVESSYNTNLGMAICTANKSQNGYYGCNAQSVVSPMNSGSKHHSSQSGYVSNSNNYPLKYQNYTGTGLQSYQQYQSYQAYNGPQSPHTYSPMQPSNIQGYGQHGLDSQTMHPNYAQKQNKSFY